MLMFGCEQRRFWAHNKCVGGPSISMMKVWLLCTVDCTAVKIPGHLVNVPKIIGILAGCRDVGNPAVYLVARPTPISPDLPIQNIQKLNAAVTRVWALEVSAVSGKHGTQTARGLCLIKHWVVA